MPGKHALLSASGAKRWLSCPPSARLEADLPDTDTVFSTEGTLAHKLGELELAKFFELESYKSERSYKSRLNNIKKDDQYSQSMQDYIDEYVSFIAERYGVLRKDCPDTKIFLEQRLDFSNVVPGGFGTGDVVIVAEPVMEVIDLKYGKGVEVDAEDNAQLRLYGVGALNEHLMLYGIEEVRMTVYQPRIGNISTETLTKNQLMLWAYEQVKPTAMLAYEGQGEFDSGEWCRFCKVRATCRKRAENNLEMAKYDFAKGPELSVDEIPAVLAKCIQLEKWAKDVQEYALSQSRDHGVRWNGWKLVEGRSRRVYTDSVDVLAALRAFGCVDEAILKPAEPRSITDLTKTIGKKAVSECLEIPGLIIKPPGKPVLVPEEDKRTEIGSAASAAKDFESEEDE